MSSQEDLKIVFHPEGIIKTDYGQIRTGTFRKAPVWFKVFSMARRDTSYQLAIKQHVQLLKDLTDSHLIQVYDAFLCNEDVLLVMDHADGGSLHSAIKEGRLTDWALKERIFREIAQGLAFIHYMGVTHQGLESSNVLLTAAMRVKISDVGLTSLVGRPALDDVELPKGSVRWMAPELLVKSKPPQKHTAKSDVYALGMVMWEMAANSTVPFRDLADKDVRLRVLEGKREAIPSGTPRDNYGKWIERCWDQNPDKRPNAHEMSTLMSLSSTTPPKPKTLHAPTMSLASLNMSFYLPE
ncbi:hypothetical protein BGW42_006269, partial [Actinomortierella wolfii]